MSDAFAPEAREQPADAALRLDRHRGDSVELQAGARHAIIFDLTRHELGAADPNWVLVATRSVDA